MPSFTLTTTAAGPLVDVQVGVSGPLRHWLMAAKQPVPAAVPAIFLVDTGASISLVDSGLMRSLSLSPRSTVLGHTASTKGLTTSFDQYDVSLYLKGPGPGSGWNVDALPVAATTFTNVNFQGLIGRDVLNLGILIYNGPTKHFTLAY